MNITAGGLSFEMPDGWTDRSTITFTMPPDDDLKDPRALQQQSSHAAGNLSMSWEPASEALTPASVLDAQLAQLPAALPACEVLERGETADGYPFAELRADLGVTVRQLLCARTVGERVVVITGSASEPLFARVKAHALALLTSLSPS